jgi:hypothetical protein
MGTIRIRQAMAFANALLGNFDAYIAGTVSEFCAEPIAPASRLFRSVVLHVDVTYSAAGGLHKHGRGFFGRESVLPDPCAGFRLRPNGRTHGIAGGSQPPAVRIRRSHSVFCLLTSSTPISHKGYQGRSPCLVSLAVSLALLSPVSCGKQVSCIIAEIASAPRAFVGPDSLAGLDAILHRAYRLPIQILHCLRKLREYCIVHLTRGRQSLLLLEAGDGGSRLCAWTAVDRSGAITAKCQV